MPIGLWMSWTDGGYGKSTSGAAGGANYVSAWRETLVSHIRTALKIGHPLERIVVLEHRDCGAYKEFFHFHWDRVTPPDEEAEHKKQVALFIADMKREFAAEIPNLKIDALLRTRDEDGALQLETP